MKTKDKLFTIQMIEIDEVNRLISIMNDLDHISILYKWFFDEKIITDARNQICELVNNMRDRFDI